MTESDIEFVKRCIAEDVHRFYVWNKWKKKRDEVLRGDKNNCLECKKRGKRTKANTVHHVNYLKNHPELALEMYYVDKNGETKRNLVSLCHDCHERIHGYRVKRKKEVLTPERW